MVAPPPVRSSIDERGVDLITGAMTLSVEALSVGPAGGGGLSFSRSYIGSGWRESFVGTINQVNGVYTVSIGGASEAFTFNGATFDPQAKTGSELAPVSGGYAYTTRDGTVVSFGRGVYPNLGPWTANVARISKITKPDGEIITFTYGAATYCVNQSYQTCEPDGTWERKVERLDRISNNLGYEITLDYVRDNITTGTNTAFLYELSGAHATNLATGVQTGSVAFSGVNSTTRTMTDALNRVTEFSYGAPGLTGVHFPQGSTFGFTLEYDGFGRVQKVLAPLGTWTYAYVDNGGKRTTTVTDPNQHTRTVVSDIASSLVDSDANGVGLTSSYHYDAYGRVDRVIKPENGYTQYVYDGRGNITQVQTVAKNASATITTLAAYGDVNDPNNPKTRNKPNSITDGRSNVTNYQWDANSGLLTTVTQPAPTPDGVRPQTRIWNQPQAAYFNGAAAPPVIRPIAVAQCITTSSCAGNADEIVQWIYHVPEGWNAATPTPHNGLTYGLQRGSQTGALGVFSWMSYDDRGNPASSKDPLGRVTYYRYDAGGRKLGEVGPDPDGGGPLKPRAVRYTYDGPGLLKATEQGTLYNWWNMSDWAGFDVLAKQEVGYDDAGRAVKQALVTGGIKWTTTQAGYDAAGLPECTAVRMNRGPALDAQSNACAQGYLGIHGPDRITKTTYDAADRVKKVTSGFGLGASVQRDDVTREYGTNGLVWRETDAKGNQTTYLYDGFDRLKQVTFPDGRSEVYGYDANSNVTSHTRRDGTEMGYGYDALNRLTSGDGSVFTYDNLGRVLTVTKAGTTITFGYDALGRRTSEQGPLGTVSSAYDAVGNRTKLTWPNGTAVEYEYNADDSMRLVRESGSGLNLTSWYWDDMGRRTQTARYTPGVNTVYGYGGDLRLSVQYHFFPNGADNQVYSFEYTASGQLERMATWNVAGWTAGAGGTWRGYGSNALNQYTAAAGNVTFGHDDRGNLTQDTGPDPYGAMKTTTFGYDAMNRLVSRADGAAGAPAPSPQLTLSYDALGRLFATTGGATTRFLYEGDRIIGEYAANGTLLRRFVPGASQDETAVWYEETLAASHADYRRWLLHDRMGSVTHVINASAQKLITNTYDEAGLPGPANAGRFQYVGQPWIPEAGLYHMRARAYSPTLGRFLQPDPIGYGDGMNMYAYVGNDPVNAWDPSGLASAVLKGKAVGGDLNGQQVPYQLGSTPTRVGNGHYELGKENTLFFKPDFAGFGGRTGIGGADVGATQGNDGGATVIVVAGPPQSSEQKKFCSNLASAVSSTQGALPSYDSQGPRFSDPAALAYGLEVSTSQSQFGDLAANGIPGAILTLLGVGAQVHGAGSGGSRVGTGISRVSGGFSLQSALVGTVGYFENKAGSARAAAYQARLTQLSAQRAGICP